MIYMQLLTDNENACKWTFIMNRIAMIWYFGKSYDSNVSSIAVNTNIIYFITWLLVSNYAELKILIKNFYKNKGRL